MLGLEKEISPKTRRDDLLAVEVQVIRDSLCSEASPRLGLSESPHGIENDDWGGKEVN